MMNAAAAPSPDESEESAVPDPDAQPATPPSGDDGQSPLSSINIEPAEDDSAVVTHHHKVSDRVKHMGYHEPTKHVTKGHKDLMKHLEKHSKRLKP